MYYLGSIFLIYNFSIGYVVTGTVCRNLKPRNGTIILIRKPLEIYVAIIKFVTLVFNLTLFNLISSNILNYLLINKNVVKFKYTYSKNKHYNMPQNNKRMVRELLKHNQFEASSILIIT